MFDELAHVSGISPFTDHLRVLHVEEPTCAGESLYLSDVARHQLAGGWEIHVAGPEDPRVEGVTWHEWSVFNRRSAPNGPLRWLRDVVGECRPDVAVLHSAAAGLMGRAALRASLTTVISQQIWSFDSVSTVMRPLAILCERGASRWANAVIVGTPWDAETGTSLRIRVPPFIVPQPVLSYWSPASTRDRDERRTKLGLHHGPLAVYCGAFPRGRRLAAISSAWRCVSRQVPNAQLAIVSATSDRDWRPTPDWGVTLAGRNDDVSDWLVAADLVIVPQSTAESNLLVFEALTRGRSVLTPPGPLGKLVTGAGAGASVRTSDGKNLASALLVRLAGNGDMLEEGVRGSNYMAVHHNAGRSLDRLAAVIARAHAFGYPSARQWRETRRQGGPRG